MDQKSEMKYNLLLSDEQADVLVRALDLYSRIGIGQFEEVLNVYDRHLKLDLAQRETLRHLLTNAKMAVGLPANGGPSIGNQEKVREEFRVAWDIQQVVRHRLSHDRRPEGNPSNMNFDTPHHTSQLPLPGIERIKE